MGWRFHRSIKIGPFRLNFSKSGIGYSVGGKGYRVGRDARGRRYRSLSIPGTGLRKTEYERGKASKPAGSGCAVLFLLLLCCGGIGVCIPTSNDRHPQTADSSPHNDPSTRSTVLNSNLLRSQQEGSTGASEEKGAVAELSPARAGNATSNSPQREEAFVGSPGREKFEERTWTSADGAYTTVATLVALEGEFVQLRKADGKVVSVPIGKLSSADQALVLGDPRIADFPQVIEGKVVSITDGDTLVVLNDEKETHKIRLEGIDAPESRQDYGTKSRKALAEKVFGKRVRVRWADTDKYGRILGQIYADDRWINRELVEEGWAWHYKQYSDDESLAAAEVAARTNRCGLWADPNRPVPPWEFRHPPPRSLSPEAIAPAEPSAAEETALPAMSHWLNTSSGVRHNRGCRYFGNTKRGRYCGPHEGKACGICGG